MKVHIVGAGPAGLFLAVLLARDGHAVHVHERGLAASSAGFGLTLMDGFVEELTAADATTGEAVLAAAHTWDSQTVEILGRRPVRGPAAGYSIRRSHLVEILTRRALDLGVDVRYSSGVDDPAALGGSDLLVAADGASSAVRNAHRDSFGTVTDRRRNLYTWLGTTKEFDGFRFTFAPTSAGWVWVGAHTFDSGSSGFIVEMDPRTHAGLGLASADTSLSMRILQDVFADLLDGHELFPQQGRGGGVPWQHFTRVTNSTWHHGRLVLVGDAAHTTHFTIGSGTRLAMQDAAELARQLQTLGSGERIAPTGAELAHALQTYTLTRQRQIADVSREARNSLLWFEHVERYTGAGPEDFAMFYDRRRTALHRYLPVPAYLAATRAASAVPALGALAGVLRPGQRLAGAHEGGDTR